MRIIRGKYKGKIISPPKGFNSRPTTDYAKESLFNIIESRVNIQSLRVLDIFSGSGNISFEFLSRECKEVVSVENNKKYSDHIRKQISQLFPKKGKVICTDAFKFCQKSDLDFDIIFADPPFNHKDIKTIPDLILNNKSLNNKALIIVEHPNEINFSEHSNYIETRRYGNISFSFFQKDE
ncbi:MAG: 16S rRNA (guanine(966)-N(2))-methyltransferase RsmD [Bacteroidales bacterium]|nr:16S rRNA (guanine(966)-N(2))-methyltransferase RsmD [Bacteroidales bacterium]